MVPCPIDLKTFSVGTLNAMVSSFDWETVNSGTQELWVSFNPADISVHAEFPLNLIASIVPGLGFGGTKRSVHTTRKGVL